MALTLDFADKHVLVFGGTTGISFGIAGTFAKHGAKVSVASRKQENVDTTVSSLAAAGGKVMGVVAVRHFAAVGRAFEAACEQFGSIDVVVSGAARKFLDPINEPSPNGFRVVVDIDLIGTFHLMRAAFPYLTKPGASVVRAACNSREQ